MTYSSSVALSRRTIGRRSRSEGLGRRGRNTVSFKARTQSLGPISNTIILIVLTCLIGLLYLTQVTKTNSYGYTINNLQNQQSQLQNQKNNLEVNAARLQSLNRVAASNAAKGLVPATPSGVVNQ